MLDLTGVSHHPALEEIVGVLCTKTQNTDRSFFRVTLAYFFGKMASSMRANVVTKDRGDIPVNIYALALATSGYGKGHSVNVMENDFMAGFKKAFMEETFPTIAEANLFKLATERAIRNNTEQEFELDKIEKEFRGAGALPYTFDSGTPAAIKQLRQKLLLAEAGAINLQIDEIGSNLVGNTDILGVYLELYDQGMVKQKLTKNTAENTRGEELDGKTPANALLFGTPSKLLDGGQVEDHFYSFLDTGYARRCLFAWGQQDRKAFNSMTPEEIYRRLIQPSNSAIVDKWRNLFTALGDPTMFGRKIMVEDEVGIKLIEYKIACEQYADTLAEHEEIRKAEISHRYFKALKLAGAYAFIDQTPEVTMSQLMQAILLVEESGESFKTILNREKTYVKLAKYIASIGTDVTHADLHEALPFYKSGAAARNEMMNLAIAWGYGQHINIKKLLIDNIEFFRGSTLQKTDLSKVRIAYGKHYAFHYDNVEVPFDQLHRVTQYKVVHQMEEGTITETAQWVNHHVRENHRAEDKIISGFNLIVIDVDGGVRIDMVQELLKEYVHMIYTTKSHTPEDHRFRLIIPMNYFLELDSEEYKEFMNNIMKWLPFDSDESANQRSKKWEAHNGEYFYNTENAELLDVLPFIPRTSKNEQFIQNYQKVENLDSLERWFIQRMSAGNRNNQMIKYAYALVDSGMSLADIQKQVHAFNQKLSNPLPEAELDSTVLRSVASRFVPK